MNTRSAKNVRVDYVSRFDTGIEMHPKEKKTGLELDVEHTVPSARYWSPFDILFVWACVQIGLLDRQNVLLQNVNLEWFQAF